MTIWRSLLAFFSVAAHPASEHRREVMAQFEAKMARHSRDVLSVEASALSRVVQAEMDPDRREIKRLNIERQDTLDAFVKGKRGS